MKNYSLFAVLSLAATILFACNEIDNVGFDMESAVEQQMAGKTHSINVSQSEASGIADMFMRSYAGSDMPLTKSADTKRISSSATVREDGQDLMYVFNYEDGGFVIVGSTRNYYPILAYSDKGSFVLQDDMGPVDVWLDETKVSIKNSSSLDAATKAQMQNLWSHYDGTYVDPAQQLLASRRPQTRSAGEDACWERIDSLQALYGIYGWTFTTVSAVEQLFDDYGLSIYYDEICYYTEQNHSALNETLIGYKSGSQYSQVGPHLSTYGWHQYSPFNNQCNGKPAGSGAIAVAQVIKYHGYPGSITWNGYPIALSTIPDYADSNSDQDYFVGFVGDLVNMSYGSSFSWCTPANVTSGLNSIGYTASKSSHSDASVRTYIHSYSPVIMVGNSVNNPIYSSNSHYWVCDGVSESTTNQITYFTENQPYGAGSFTQGMYTMSYPGTVGGIHSYHYHMNWGKNDNNDGWYASNYPSSSNYQYYRQDIFVTSPI